MAGTAATRSSRAGRVAAVLAVFVAVLALGTTATPGAASADLTTDPGSAPAAAPRPAPAAGPAPAPGPSGAAPAPTSAPGPSGAAPAPTSAPAPSGAAPATDAPGAAPAAGPPGAAPDPGLSGPAPGAIAPGPAPGASAPGPAPAAPASALLLAASRSGSVLAAGPSGPPSLDRAAASAGGGPAPAAERASVAPPAPAPVDRLRVLGARAAAITARATTWASFTLLDRRTGRRTGDARSAETTNTESTVKAWLAADLLATRAAQGRPLTAYDRSRMAVMIQLSDDNAAQTIWRELGGNDSIRKMIRTCRLTDTQVYPAWWSLTQISSRDLARLGDCIVPGRGRFLSPAVGAPLVALMRSVAPSNAFGIPQVRPAGAAGRVAVKNGWTEHGGTGLWNVNCLGIWGPGDRWVLAVTTRYPIARGLDHGAALCRRVTTALLPLVRS